METEKCESCQYYFDLPYGYPFCNNENSENYFKNIKDIDSCSELEKGKETMQTVDKELKKFEDHATLEEKSNGVTLRKDKTSEILRHLKEKGNITSMEAFELYGATRLSAIIFTLRKRGYDIQNKSEVCTDRYGHVCNYVRYVLEEDNV